MFYENLLIHCALLNFYPILTEVMCMIHAVCYGFSSFVWVRYELFGSEVMHSFATLYFLKRLSSCDNLVIIFISMQEKWLLMKQKMALLEKLYMYFEWVDDKQIQYYFHIN